MLKIYDIGEKQEYLEEVVTLTRLEWGNKNDSKEAFNNKVKEKIEIIKNNFDNPYFAKLILLDDDNLVGFISLFEKDGDRVDLKPWYATMYVKKEYRGKGYSKILNEAILKEAKKRGFERVYLKTDLINYYEKFGAIYMEDLNNGEKLYYIDIK